MMGGDEGQREDGRLNQLQGLSQGYFLDWGNRRSEMSRCDVRAQSKMTGDEGLVTGNDSQGYDLGGW